MILVLETFVAAVLNAVLATVVWLRYQRKDAAWLFLGAAVLRAVIAASALLYAAILFDVALAGSLAYLIRRRPTFETTREAIDQALESMAEGIAVLTAKGRVLYTNRAMEGHLNLHTGQAITVQSLMDDPGAAEARPQSSPPSEPGPPPTSREGSLAPPAPSARESEPPPSSQQGRSTLDRIEHELLRRSLGRERTEICLDRSSRSLVVAASPVLDGEGDLQGHLLLARDVSEARKYEQELKSRNVDLHRLLHDLSEGKRAEEKAHREKAEAEAANVAKSTFLANMSHELRTPLNAILGFVQLMERDRSLAGQHRENLEVIGRSGQHLLRLINDILEMSKIEAGRVSLVENSFDLHRMLKSLEEMFSVQTERKGIKLVFDRDSDVPRHVRGDEGKLRQVLINLLGNAVKFTDRGRIKLRVTRGASASSTPFPAEGVTAKVRLRFVIMDTGHGIAQGDQQRLFEAFAQAHREKEDMGGTGLGLSISREFVRLMGGEIHLTSELGEGSTFTFDVKLAPADPTEVPGERRARVAIGLASGQPSYRVLVADDRWENRNLLIKLLQLVGFDVRGAENGLEALDQWDAWEPALIWMDMRMPVMDGYEATKRIKATLRGQATVIIALTASAFEHDRAMVLEVGCDDFVRKPFRDADVFEKMEQHLGVRFVYEDRGPALAEGRTPDQILDEGTLTTIPKELLAELRRGATELNTKAVQAIIEQIRKRDAAIADALSELVRGYRFDTILELTERAGELP